MTDCTVDWLFSQKMYKLALPYKRSYCHFSLIIRHLGKSICVGCPFIFLTVVAHSCSVLDAPGIQTYQLAMNPERRSEHS